MRNLLRSWLSKFCQQSLRLTGDETDESAIDSLWQLARSAQEWKTWWELHAISNQVQKVCVHTQEVHSCTVIFTNTWWVIRVHCSLLRRSLFAALNCVMMKMSQADALLYAYATSVQFTSKNLAICILLLFGHGKDWIVATLFGTLINCYNYYCYRSYTTWRVNGTFCIFTCHSSISQSIVFWGTALMAGEEERDYKPCSPTKNMECAPIWCSPFASFCRLRHRFWNMSKQLLYALVTFIIWSKCWRVFWDLDSQTPRPESGIVVQWLRNYFFQCTNEEADLNEKRLRALLAMHQDPSAGNRQIDPWAHLQRYGSSAAFIFFGYVLGCSLPLQISFMPVKTSQINNW